MKHIIILILGLFTLSVSAQDLEVPYDFPIPKDWGTEKIPFPISFAPQIPYKGIEEIRFAPGWGGANRDGYWTYVFLWYLDGKQKIDAKTLESHLKDYYEGLITANGSKVPKEKLTPVKVSNNKEHVKNDHDKCFEGTVLMTDYMSQKPITLNYKVSLQTCLGEDKTLVFFKLSPQPYVHYVWKGLDKVVNDFKCKK